MEHTRPTLQHQERSQWEAKHGAIPEENCLPSAKASPGLPEHCRHSYTSRSKGRKRKPQVSWWGVGSLDGQMRAPLWRTFPWTIKVFFHWCTLLPWDPAIANLILYDDTSADIDDTSADSDDTSADSDDTSADSDDTSADSDAVWCLYMTCTSEICTLNQWENINVSCVYSTMYWYLNKNYSVGENFMQRTEYLTIRSEEM